MGTEKPSELSKDDDEFDAYRKRMMLAYRFRPNPLVSSLALAAYDFFKVFVSELVCFLIACAVCLRIMI